MTMLRETTAAIRIALGGVTSRWTLALATIIGVALTVLVLTGFLAMAHGFRRTLEQTGSPEVAIITSKGAATEASSLVPADAVPLIAALPEVEQVGGTPPLVSAELYQTASVTRPDGSVVGLTLRGVGPAAMQVRGGMRVAAGRWFRPGTAEIVVGSAAASQFPGLGLGRTVRLGANQWRVVGLFNSGSAAAGSEIWADARTVQSLYHRPNAVQSVRARLRERDMAASLADAIAADPRLSLSVEREDRFYRAQSTGLVSLMEKLGWPLGLLMAIGAAAGAINTMSSSVTARTREIAMLRAIGFGRLATFAAVMIESLVLAAIGGLAGVAASWILFDGLRTSTTGAGMNQLVFSFSVGADALTPVMMLALAIGFVGGLGPAIRAARMPVLRGLAAG